jgi:hypothetical protein
MIFKIPYFCHTFLKAWEPWAYDSIPGSEATALATITSKTTHRRLFEKRQTAKMPIEEIEYI